MVIVACGDERGAVAVALFQLEAEHATIEAERPLDVGDLEMDMADPDARVDRLADRILARIDRTHLFADRHD